MASTLEQHTGTPAAAAPGRPPEAGSGPAGPLARLGRWTATHLRAVLLIWLVIIGTFGVFAVRAEHALAGAGWQDSTSQSVRARDIVQRHFAGLGSTALQVVIVDHHGTLTADPAAQKVVAASHPDAAVERERVRRGPPASRAVALTGRPHRHRHRGRGRGPQRHGEGGRRPRGSATATLAARHLGHPDRRQRAVGQLQRRQPVGHAPLRDAVVARHDRHPHHRLREPRRRRPPAPAHHGRAPGRRRRARARDRGDARLHLGVELRPDVRLGAGHRLCTVPRRPLPRRPRTQGCAAR